MVLGRDGTDATHETGKRNISGDNLQSKVTGDDTDKGWS